MGGDSCYEGRGFESQHRILYGHKKKHKTKTDDAVKYMFCDILNF